MKLEWAIVLAEFLGHGDARVPAKDCVSTMRFNHLDLQVSNVPEARSFFETHFGLRCVYARGEEIALLDDGSGFSFGVSNLFQSPAPSYPPDFHIGFVRDDAAEVKAIYERLKAAGVAIRNELAQGGPNLYFTCYGPDRIPVEVRAPLKAKAG